MAAVTNSVASTLLGSYQSVARAFVASVNLGTDVFSGQVFHGLGASPDTIFFVTRSSQVVSGSSLPLAQVAVLSWDATVVALGFATGGPGNQGIVVDVYTRREHTIVR